MSCKHPKKLRRHIDSCTSICDGCGMYHAMIAGKRSVYRRWVPPTDPRIDFGKLVTETLLAGARSHG